MEPGNAVDWLLELIELVLPEFNPASLGNLIRGGFSPSQPEPCPSCSRPVRLERAMIG